MIQKMEPNYLKKEKCLREKNIFSHLINKNFVKSTILFFKVNFSY